jgi:hypothetical protein
MCRVQGTLAFDGGPLDVDCGGVRSGAVAKSDSLRLLAAWFPDDVSLALRAVRPPGAKGHDRDAVAALLRDAHPVMTVFDPRLSTTFADAGDLARIGVELWLGAAEEDDLLPQRAAGESAGTRAVLGDASRQLEAYLLRCQSAGTEGAGLFVLARPARS